MEGLKSRLLVLGVAVALIALALPKTSWACPGSQDKGCVVAGNSTTLDLGIASQQKQMVQQTGAVFLQSATPVAMATVGARCEAETPSHAATVKTVARDTLRFTGYHATQFGTLEQPVQRAIDKTKNTEECVDSAISTTKMITTTTTQTGSLQETYITPRATVERTSADIGIQSCVLKKPLDMQADAHQYTVAATSKATTKSGDAVLLVGSFVWVGGTSTDPKTGVTLTSSGTWYGPVSAPTGHQQTKTGISADP